MMDRDQDLEKKLAVASVGNWQDYHKHADE